MYEIIAEPQDYGIQVLKEGMGENHVSFDADERQNWAEEIGTFASKLGGLSDRAKKLQQLLISDEPIVATPASLKALKVALFQINDAVAEAMNIADKIETQIIQK